MGKILVTGANGFVGNHLVEELAAHRHEVVAVGGPQGSASVSTHISEYKVVDLTDAGAVAALDLSGIDGIIHLAGLAAVGPSFDQPLKYISFNAGMEINLFEAAVAQNVKPRFLIISSGSLYDPKATLPLTEDSPVAPSSPYAVSKIAQEQMARYYGNRGFECIIARPFNHIGPGQGLGFLVPDLMQQVLAIKGGKADKILVGNLDAKRDYTDVRDIVRAYRLLLEQGTAGQTYNICSGASRSGHEVLDAILQATTVQAAVEQDASRMRPSDAPDIYGSHDKLSADTGWQPEITLATTLADIIKS